MGRKDGSINGQQTFLMNWEWRLGWK